MDWIVVAHSSIFLIFWLTNLSFQQEVNKFLFDATGFPLNYLLIFIIFTTLIGLWSALQLILKKKKHKGGPPWLTSVSGWFYLFFFYGSFSVLFIKNPVQIARLGQLVQYFRLFVDTTLLFIIAWGVRKLPVRPKSSRMKGLFAGLLFLLWMFPVLWTPGAVVHGLLPMKPLLIAHRGASALAPENTLAAMQIASDLKVYGLETDITISKDGILFLMHDATLERTTNIAEIFPQRVKDPANRFTWSELTQLDAGSWFLGQTLYSDEPIPTLAEVLPIVKNNGLYLIYDLRIPLADHPFADETNSLCLEEIKSFGAPARTWILVNSEDIPSVRAVLPQAILSAGIDYRLAPTAHKLLIDGYQVVNSEFGISNSRIHDYTDAGIWVNVWTVDEPWQFSRLWLAGANSVTSNNIQGLLALPRPVLVIMYPVYLVMWGIAGILAAALAFS